MLSYFDDKKKDNTAGNQNISQAILVVFLLGLSEGVSSLLYRLLESRSFMIVSLWNQDI